MITQADIEKSLRELGLQAGDTVLFHSSLKSFGMVDGGAETVIRSFLNVVTKNGTVIVPTFAQKNFEEAYKSWHMDKPSDTGYITEVFRKRPNALRSDQATHSVAAIGLKAEYYTKTHGQSGVRIGVFGNTPFSKDSPWQKMYDDNVKIVLVGVGFKVYTMRHLLEYTLIEEGLENARKRGEYESYAERICTFEKRSRRNEYIWPFLSADLIYNIAAENELYKTSVCGNAKLMAVCCKDLGEILKEDLYAHPERWFEDEWYAEMLEWIKVNIKKENERGAI